MKNVSKGLLSFGLAILVIVSSLGLRSLADFGEENAALGLSGEETIFGSTDTVGLGTPSNPLEITTAEMLADFAALVNQGGAVGEIYASEAHVVLMGNINLSGLNWQPIGNTNYPFSGSFNGQSYTISGLNINSGEPNQGLFGVVTSGTVTAVNLENTNISAGENVGGIAGTANNSIINGCNVNASITGTTNVGGIVGDSNNSIIEYSSASGSVNGSGVIGGIAGSATNSSRVLDCSFSGNFTGYTSNTDGIVGLIDDYSTISASYVDSSLGDNKADSVGELSSHDSATGAIPDALPPIGTLVIGVDNLILTEDPDNNQVVNLHASGNAVWNDPILTWIINPTVTGASILPSGVNNNTAALTVPKGYSGTITVEVGNINESTEAVTITVNPAGAPVTPFAPFTVTITNYGNGNPTPNTFTNVLIGDTLTITPNPNLGYQFKELKVISGSAVVLNNQIFNVNADTVITAYYETIPIGSNPVKALTSSSSRGTVTSSKQNAVSGDTVILDYVAKPGYKFKEWNVTSSNVTMNGNSFTMPDAPVVIIGVFELIPTVPVTNSITVSTSDSSRGTITSSHTSAVQGTIVALTPSANAGYQFKHWNVTSGNVTMNGNSFTMPNAPVVIIGVFEPKAITHKVTISSDGNGSAASGGQTVVNAVPTMVVNLTASPNAGYKFLKWEVLQGTVTLTGDWFNMPTHDVKVKATFEPIATTYKVTISSDGNGSAASGGQTVVNAVPTTVVNLTASPNTGYKFLKWEVLQGTVTLTGDWFNMPAHDVQVKAIFEPIATTYKVTISSDGNGSAASGGQTVVNSAPTSVVNLTASPNTGYKFLKWEVLQGTVTLTGDWFNMPAHDVQVKAIFEPIATTYKVEAFSDSNGVALANNQTAINLTAGEKVTLTATPNTSYKFLKWEVIQGGVTLTGDWFNMPTHDVKVKATFEPIATTYKVEAFSDSNGVALANGQTIINTTAGEKVTLTATPNTSYKFLKWEVIQGGVTLTGDWFNMPTHDVRIRAIFESAVTYQLDILTDGNGVASGNGSSSLSILAGETVTLSATPKPNYRFKEWRVDQGTVAINGNWFVMPSHGVKITAIFELIPVNSHPVIVEFDSGHGSAYATPNTAVKGETVRLYAAPKTGYRFTSWTVHSGNATITTGDRFIMPDNPVTVRANFEPLYYSVSVVQKVGGSGTASPSTAVYGQTVALTATPAAGYRFVGWSSTDVPNLANTQATSFTMPNKNVTIHPIFEPLPYYTVTVTAATGGTASANITSAKVGEKITLSQRSNSGYSFYRWVVVSGGVTISNNSFIMPAGNVEVRAEFSRRSTGGGSGGGWSGGSGSGSNQADQSSKPPTTGIVVSTKPNPNSNIGTIIPGVGSATSWGGGRTFTTSTATSLFNEGIRTIGSKSIVLRAKNYDFVSGATLRELANLAARHGVNITIYFDEMIGNRVINRLTVNPRTITRDLYLTSHASVATQISRSFARHFSNKTIVLSYENGGINTRVATKLPAGMHVNNLVFYSYNSSTNNYSRITNPGAWLDGRGYIHFNTHGAAHVVISSGALARK